MSSGSCLLIDIAISEQNRVAKMPKPAKKFGIVRDTGDEDRPRRRSRVVLWTLLIGFELVTLAVEVAIWLWFLQR